ncbi:MAG: PPE family protein [Actinomycetia bacterium]|nr:PPE family protein [Actinomycetes bacterium]
MPIPAPPIWHAAPPEVHSTLLTAGATPAGIVAAGTSWATLAAQYGAGLAELEAIMGQVQATYQGPSAEAFIAAHMPMKLWLGEVMVKATLAATAHTMIAESYAGAVAVMPTMAELITNHVVHGVLVSTNFFGVNTIPIGMNEADYVRMWNQAADTMAVYDGATTASVDSIVETPPSPITLIPGVGEAGNAAASAASAATTGMAANGGVMLTGAEMLSSKLLAGKAATSPASLLSYTPGAQTTSGGESAANQSKEGARQTVKPENMANNFMQQAQSLASAAPQAASSAIQGPTQMLTQAPQMLASAPQQLSSLLGSFGSGSELGQQGFAGPVGFAGTGAISGINPAGMTSLAGGALGSGPSRPLMPSTWGATPAPSAPLSAQAVSPLAAGMPSASAGGGAAGGGAMMGSGAQRRGSQAAQQVNTYTDDLVDDDTEDADAEGDGGMFAMAR